MLKDFLKESWNHKASAIGPVLLRITLGILWLEMGIQNWQAFGIDYFISKRFLRSIFG
ncbi:MAG: hypothetical protein HZC10_02950 [Nitrospirae bacterium]|nr:hypothetical protein [Nitrospirota bacterium]